MIWQVPGLRVGHTTHAGARTGCTVVLGERPLVASGEVRGGAPATREFALLDPAALVERVDAVVLTGGSAFGLAACDGVVRRLGERGRGFPTSVAPVPVVVGMGLFDLGVGDAEVRPDADDGHAAAGRALDSPSTELGPVGAGAGATVSSWRMPDPPVPGGLGGAVERDGDLVVAALVAVNAWGDVAGSAIATEPSPVIEVPQPGGPSPREATTIGVVATNAALTKLGCLHVARGGHDGLARSLTPPHASVDGDALVALAEPADGSHGVDAPIDRVRLMAVRATEAAVRSVAT